MGQGVYGFSLELGESLRIGFLKKREFIILYNYECKEQEQYLQRKRDHGGQNRINRIIMRSVPNMSENIGVMEESL